MFHFYQKSMNKKLFLHLDLYLSLFGPDAVSARAAIGASDLARDIPVEIEGIFEIGT